MSREATSVSTITSSLPGAFVPPHVGTWLRGRGWTSNFVNGEEVFTRDVGLMHFTWEQAVAYEYYTFVTLGGVNGQDAP